MKGAFPRFWFCSWHFYRPIGLCAVVVIAATVAGAARAERAKLLDAFNDIEKWEARPADGVTMTLATEQGLSGAGMRLDYDFGGHGGWASARRRLPLELPENWELAFFWRGTPARQTLEVKLLDQSGENVWWSVRRDVRPPADWERVTIKKRHLSFAWGPAGGGEMTRVAQIELTITASEGGRGSVWFDELIFLPLPPPQPYDGKVVLSASSAALGNEPALAWDGDSHTCWRALAGASGEQWLTADFGVRREFGGLVIAWGDGAAPGDFAVQLSSDGRNWETVWHVDATHGTRSFVPLPEAEARYLRLVMAHPGPAGIAVAELEVQPLDFAATPNEFVAAVAKRSRRGLFPRGFLGEMSRWTVVGSSPGGSWRGLLSADGAFEVAPRSYSLEPFVLFEDQLTTWADVTTSCELFAGDLPIPSVTWSHPRFSLEISALVSEEPTPTASLVRYRLTNRRVGGKPPSLVVALRPFQVNPPSQFLGQGGGVVEHQVLRVDFTSATLTPAHLAYLPRPRPTKVGTAAFDDGDVVTFLERGALPHRETNGPYPSAAWQWDFDLPHGAAAEVVVLIPHQAVETVEGSAVWGQRTGGLEADWNPAIFTSHLERATRVWRSRLATVAFELPSQAQELLETARANLAYILINRDGAALQPGARAYRRAWIRDGAMIASALLRLGKVEEVMQFARWYASFQYANGKVPCCVDERGADPVPEHDSDGQFIFTVAETVRISDNRVFAAELWPAIVAAAGHIDALRAQRRTAAYRHGEARRFFGLLPQSISHEGYAAKPMHSYWDNFWALRGLTDAAWLAELLGHSRAAARLAASRDELRHDLVVSLQLSMRHHGIDFFPGSAELGDFDPTSTTVALTPAAVARWLPAEPLARTFKVYWDRFQARRDGSAQWREFTPYELRTVAAFIRLGWREQAWELLAWFMAHRQPAAWRQWPEIVWQDQLTARFVGDLPHTWVGSDFLRAFLDVFAFEREEDSSLVIAAGVPAGWLDSGERIAVTGLRTQYGALSYSMLGDDKLVRVSVAAGVAIPPGGVVVALPSIPPRWEGVANGRRVHASPSGEFRITELPLDLIVARSATGQFKEN